jgi:protein-tyrosine phosphatase
MRNVTGYPLWLGHAGDVREPAALLESGISAVVCVAANEPLAALPRDVLYCRFPLIDGAGNPDWLLRMAVETVASLLRSGIPTLVYCSAGMSRSPAVAGAALTLVSGCSPSDGLIVATETAGDVSPVLWAEIERVVL